MQQIGVCTTAADAAADATADTAAIVKGQASTSSMGASTSPRQRDRSVILDCRDLWPQEPTLIHSSTHVIAVYCGIFRGKVLTGGT